MQHEEIARTAQRLNLPREDLVIPEIVGGGGEDRGVGGERNRGERPPRLRVAHHVFGGEVLRIGRAAAVAAEEDRPAPL